MKFYNSVFFPEFYVLLANTPSELEFSRPQPFPGQFGPSSRPEYGHQTLPELTDSPTKYNSGRLHRNDFRGPFGQNWSTIFRIYLFLDFANFPVPERPVFGRRSLICISDEIFIMVFDLFIDLSFGQLYF